MIIAGMLIGGAIMPSRAAMEMIAPVLTLSTPSALSTGATSAPVVSTEAVDEPVIMPGTMTISIRPILSSAGKRRNLRISHADSASSRPILRMTFIKTMAVAITRIVFR